MSDLVDERRGEAYGDPEIFRRAARQIMRRLLESLPAWLDTAGI